MTFPITLTSIGLDAFAFDFSLSGDVYFPNSITTFTKESFKNTNIDIAKWPNKITTIPRSCFWECKSLTTLPDRTSLTTIEEQAFLSCSKLGFNEGNGTSITDYLNNSNVTEIQTGAFYMCSYIKGQRSGANGNIQNYKGDSITLKGSPFSGTKVIYEAEIPTTGTTITANKFLGVTSFTNCITTNGEEKILTIPSNITTIGTKAFQGCSGFTKLIIPNTVSSIGDYAFSYMADVKEIEFSTGSPITGISAGLFRADMTLEKITLPENLTSIANAAFFDTYVLEGINIPSSVTSIGGSAFAWSGYYGTFTSITLPSSLKTIGEKAFRGCCWLDSIEIPDTVTSIGANAFDGCFAAQTIVIGSGVTSIPKECFSLDFPACWRNTEVSTTKIVIRGTLNSIGESAFNGHNKLETIEGINWGSLSSIGEKAFCNCSSLNTSGTLNSSCSVGADAFFNCLTYPIQNK